MLTEPADASPVDALIVGAGPAGSATGYWLAQAGYRVTLVDRSPFPRDKPCSEYMGPGAVEAFERLGVLSDLQAAGAYRLDGTTVIASRGGRLTGRFALASAQQPEAAGLSLPRRILDHCLLRHAIAGGARVMDPAAVDDLLLEDGLVSGVVIRGASGERRIVRARLTVGADGLRSIVARRLSGVNYGNPRRIGFIAHVSGVSGLNHTTEMHVGRAGYIGLNPLGNGLANVALVVPVGRVAEARGRVEDFFFATLEEFPRARGRVPRSGLTGPVLTTGPFSVRARAVIADGAVLVGDSADFFDPFTGEGIFSALRGAELVALVAGDALQQPGPITAKRLAAYPRLRRREFAGKWAVERMIGFGMLAPRLFDRAVDRLGRRGSMAHTLIGVTADFLPAREVLNPLFLGRMVI
jgi:flavin-dependent dehydrogenase